MQSIIKIRSVVVLLIANLIISLCSTPIVYLNENQILYAMSTLAQVIAGLFGLVLAAYAIIDPKLKDIGNQSKQSSDYVDTLRSRYFQNIIVLSVICAITILSSLLTINLYTEVSDKLFSILISQASIFGFFSILCFLYFGCSLLNPNALEKISKEEKKEIEDGYGSNLMDDDFKPFVAYYNKLESLIFEFATELMDKDLQGTINLKYRNGRMQIFQALDILVMNEIINRQLYEKIDELRRYRNALVHSTDDQKVIPQIFNELKELYSKLFEVYKNKDDQEERIRAIQNLYAFSSHISLSQLDQQIIEIITNHAGISAHEMALKLQVTRATLSRHLKKLSFMEKIKEKENGYYIIS